MSVLAAWSEIVQQGIPWYPCSQFLGDGRIGLTNHAAERPRRLPIRAVNALRQCIQARTS
jgi:hypothetical protein